MLVTQFDERIGYFVTDKRSTVLLYTLMTDEFVIK